MGIKSVKFRGQYEPEAYVEVERFNSHSANYLTVKGEEGGSPKSVDISDAHAHALAQFILDNVPKPNPLPTEDGVYIAANIAPDKSPVVFVRYNNTWRSTPTTGDPERVAKDLAARVGLLRLDVTEQG